MEAKLNIAITNRFAGKIPHVIIDDQQISTDKSYLYNLKFPVVYCPVILHLILYKSELHTLLNLPSRLIRRIMTIMK